MDTVRIGALDVRALGGDDRRGGGGGPAILLCHGFGAPGSDLVSLARVIDAGRDVRWFFPEAPIDLAASPYGGRAWWEIDFMRIQTMLARGRGLSLTEDTPEGLAEARAKLESTIAALERDHGVERSRLVIGGFSQGAMVTTEIALHADAPFAGLAILSGTLISSDRWKLAAEKTAPSLHVFQSHGRADPILPFANAEVLRDLLAAAGAKVDWVSHGGQHEIPPVVLTRLAAFARARFGD